MVEVLGKSVLAYHKNELLSSYLKMLFVFFSITHPLSLQQQGQILSDIQQHRFRFPQSTNVQPPSASIVSGSNPVDPYQSVQFVQSQSPPIITGLNQQQQQASPSQSVVTQQQTLNRPVVQPTLHQQQLIQKLRNQQLSRPGANQFAGGQHHTQTGFIPLTQNAAQFNAPPALPGSVTDLGKDPLLTPDQSAQLQKYFEEQRQQQRLKELREKQKIVEKHQQFVEKQYEKALQKAKKEHEEYLEKQRESRQKLYESLIHTEAPITHVSEPNTPRTIAPHESHLFQKALHQYFKEHPTTTTTTTSKSTTSTSTEKPRSKKPVITQIGSDDFDQQKILEQIRQQLGEDSVKSGSATTKISFLPTVQPKKQYKTLEQQELSQEDILKHLNEHIAKNPLESSNGKNYTSREINLPNGQTIEVIRTSDPNLLAGAKALNAGDSTNIINRITAPPKPSTTLAPPKAILEDLTKSIIPPGADYELIKHTQNGIEKVDGKQLGSGQKQVTFVLLEEQDDGSYKVQGVRGNNDKAKDNVDVDSILKKIKNGEIKLPPPSARPATVAPQPQTSTTIIRQPYSASSTPKAQFIRPTREPAYSTGNTYNQHQTPARSNYYPTPKPTIITSSDAVLNQYHRNSQEQESYESQPNSPEVTHIGSSTLQPASPSSHHTTRYQHNFPTSAVYSTTTQPTTFTKQEPVRSSSASIAAQYYNQNLYKESTTTQLPYTFATHPSTTYSSSQDNSVTQVTASSSAAPQQSTPGLIEILRRNGLYAMAKFLKQSGLDTILNETGPYTIFVPTDKAFRTLLVQLGGPEKAEEKFKENPRLLSGLLLHHVIPGAFEISALQDEMTGVSLAGTQLRVNQYNMHDVEWNEVKITTINGAKVLNDKQDIQIPQGIAQAVDRVMFPLPVGDIIQTLQSDRERRFTTFLRALFNSGLAETLQGAKTYTLFAPTETAFEDIPTDDLTRLVTDKELSKELVMRHVMPGTLFTSGMRYYQVKDSLDKSKKITLNKNTGRVKVNNNSILTQNIPATNGVIHAISTLL
ncbi:uncharacterized protein LOC123293668 [Chrysoperla carnea]|uniref:uncharacterized protein LOC123293668 n=1 Tax=Chrysoperla carnea TaxID=189513 RepID=UPI001D068B1B|nr:uncharacterized protein LOC123293668 [Chrysoperla carnea]